MSVWILQYERINLHNQVYTGYSLVIREVNTYHQFESPGSLTGASTYLVMSIGDGYGDPGVGYGLVGLISIAPPSFSREVLQPT